MSLMALALLNVCQFHCVCLWLGRTEKNASGWSTDMLKDLLMSVSVDDATGTGKVTEVSSINGEASAK